MVNHPIALADLACGHTGMISHIAFSPNGSSLASTSLDSSLRVWRMDQIENPKVVRAHAYNVTAVTWSPQGTVLATASDDRKVILWQYPSLTESGELEEHSHGITRLAWSPTGGELVTCSNDRRIRVFDVKQRKVKARLEGHVSLPRAISFAPSGDLLVSGSEGGTLRLWKGGQYTPDKVLYGHRAAINQMAWLPDGRVATASDDGTIRVWQARQGKCEQEIKGHDGPVKGICFSGCGSLMATKSWDQTLRLWRTDNWTPVAIIEEDTAAPFPNLSFHPKEPLLASVGAVDRVLRIWRLDMAALKQAETASQVLSFRDVEVRILLERGMEDLASAPPKRRALGQKASSRPTVQVSALETASVAPVQPVPPPVAAAPPPQPAASVPVHAPVAEVACHQCGEGITPGQIQRRQGLGFNFINCPVCETRINLEAGAPATLNDWAGARKLILAVMFTDIVDSTAIASRLGNQGMRDVRHQHFERVRSAIRAYRGFEIKTIGDSFMAAFKTVADGLDCALDVHRNTGHHEIQIRASLHVGPVEVEENDLFGSMVNFCARLMGQAEGAELIVSEEARSHAMQEGEDRHVNLTWNAYDNIIFKGFPGSWRVWSIE